MTERAAARLLWIVSAVFLILWVATAWFLRLSGRSFMHVFLVAALGTGLMNLIAHYWTHEEPEQKEYPP